MEQDSHNATGPPTEKISAYQLICHRLLSHSDFSHDLIFPYHAYKIKNCSQHPFNHTWTRRSAIRSVLGKMQLFPKVCAAEDTRQAPGTSQALIEASRDAEVDPHSAMMEMIARAYIDEESGMERVRMIFQKDHKGESSPEAVYMYTATLQVFIISFFMKYFPQWKIEKEEFIRQNRGTVFRTRLDAFRRMNDAITLRALGEAMRFSAKVTVFSASFILLSQMIASYRNRTSVMEYSVAAAITGGFARVYLGLRGFIAGSVLGLGLGSVIGVAAYAMMNGFGITQEIRHLEIIKSKVEVQRSLIGETAFQQKIKDIKENKIPATPSTI